MGIFDSRLFGWLRPRPDVRAQTLSRRAIAGGRLTSDKANEMMGYMAIEQPPDHESNWRTLNLDSKTLNKMAPGDLIQLMVDLSPEVSDGLWHYLRLCNPGWTAVAHRPGSDDVDDRAQAALDEFLAGLPFVYTGASAVPVNTVINALFINAWLRGAMLGELVLSLDGREPVNIAIPDANSIRFRKVSDEVLGNVWELGQWQNGRFVKLDVETVRYIPIDPLPGKPYGRPLISPALYTGLFLLSMLHDIKRVVMQQGWPRIDLEVDFEALAAMAPPDAQPGTKQFSNWVTDVMDEVKDVYAALEPDDAYAHSSVIKVNRPVGAVDADSLGAVDGLITALERMMARGLKMMPLLLGISESTTETNAIRQWEIQTATIKSLQHLAENMLEHLLQLALECQGIQAIVEFRFSELRASEMLRDAQTESILIQNEIAKYNAGWISQDQASEAITGTAADSPGPRVIDLGGRADEISAEFVDSLDSQDTDDDMTRAALLREIHLARRAIERQLPRDETVRSNGHYAHTQPH